MEDLKITLVQIPLAWESVSENLSAIENKIDELAETTDIIVLPEMFSTGFSMNSKALAQSMQGVSVTWMRELAAKKNCVLCGSLIIEEDSKYYNRFIWMPADGNLWYYNKRHLFRMAKENEHYREGKTRTIVEFKGWKINLQVCYDLRFPVWSRRTEKDNYDVLIYVANWPERRNYAWKSLLVARAIENQSYVIGVNRVGIDGNEIRYSGDSVGLNYLGEAISKTSSHEVKLETIQLSKSNLLDFRKSFPAELDADSFEISGLN